MSIYAISDLHGCYEEFMEMLELIKFDPKTDKLYILGDVVDRGDRSLECLQYIMRTKSIHLLQGNHEVLMLDYFADPVSGAERWFRNGGRATLEQMNNLSEPEQESILEYLRKLPFYKTINVNGRKFFLSHAGLDASVSFSRQTSRDLTWSRKEFYGHPALRNYITVFGHTPTPYIWDELGDSDNCSVWVDTTHLDKICIDSGCYYKGALAALRLDDGAVYYVRSSRNDGEYSYSTDNPALRSLFQ